MVLRKLITEVITEAGIILQPNPSFVQGLSDCCCCYYVCVAMMGMTRRGQWSSTEPSWDQWRGWSPFWQKTTVANGLKHTPFSLSIVLRAWHKCAFLSFSVRSRNGPFAYKWGQHFGVSSDFNKTMLWNSVFVYYRQNQMTYKSWYMKLISTEAF